MIVEDYFLCISFLVVPDVIRINFDSVIVVVCCYISTVNCQSTPCVNNFHIVILVQTLNSMWEDNIANLAKFNHTVDG